MNLIYKVFSATTLLLSLLSFPVMVWAGDSSSLALGLLQKMYSAPQTLNYKGTFVYSHDGTIESMQIFHKADGQGEVERLLHLNGSAREVIREKDLVTCFLSDNKTVMVNKRQESQNVFLTLPENFESLKEYYDFVIADDGRIAGRVTKTVLVQPRDAFRYGYKLWLDAETGLLLSSALLNQNFKTIERIMFTEIDIVDSIAPSLLKPTVSGKEFSWHKDLEEAGVVNKGPWSWSVKNMPLGFSASGHRIHLQKDAGSMEHIVISDGLASVSVYVEKVVGATKKFIGSSYMGAVNIYGTVVRDHQVTVVGEVPKETIRMISSSVTYIGN